MATDKTKVDIFADSEDSKLEKALERNEEGFLDQFSKTPCKVVMERRETNDGRKMYSIRAEVRRGLMSIPLAVKTKKPIDQNVFNLIMLKTGMDMSKLVNSDFKPYRIKKIYFVDKETGEKRPFYSFEVLLYVDRSVDEDGNDVPHPFILSGILNGAQRQIMNELANLPDGKQNKSVGLVKTDWKIYLKEKDEEVESLVDLETSDY